ncbi:MAG: A24 family peptidase [Candidatus Thiodiazotropha sp. (ex Epidulcina cf. delphinae)]|nr:A24 family peptidase [Candidatus Thiodiazotropha sp. (ex Epidulcina cf. delphinae)]
MTGLSVLDNPVWGQIMLRVGDMENTLPMLLVAGVASVCDLRTGKIPNPLILASLLFGLGITFLNRGTDGLLMSLAGFVTGFLLLLPGYLLRFTGAGDLKLLATLGVYGGPGIILGVFIISVIAGAIFILMKIVWRTLDRQNILSWRQTSIVPTLLMTGQFDVLFSKGSAVLKQRLPMAPFYALGCTLFILIQLIQADG